MTTVAVTYWRSEESRQRYLLATGEQIGRDGRVELDLAELTAQQREELLPVLEVAYTSNDIKHYKLFLAMPVVHTDKLSDYDRYKSEPLRFDQEPTTAEILDAARRILPAKQAMAQDRARRNQEQRRLQATVAEIEQEIGRIEKEAFSTLDFSAALNQMARLSTDVIASDLIHVTEYKRYVDSYIHSAERSLKKEQREQEKSNWITAHGSDHLQRAWGMAYDCQRLYVTERAAMEAPGYTVDFNESASWRDRSCPSMQALDELTAIEKAVKGEYHYVAWLLKPASDSVDEDDYYDYQHDYPCEAIIIRGYLGRYDLVKEIR